MSELAFEVKRLRREDIANDPRAGFWVHAGDYNMIMRQRDEGLAREAELRERLAAETGYYRSTLRNVLKDIRDDIARGGLAPSWSGVAETISIVLNTAGADRPGCADGEKAKEHCPQGYGHAGKWCGPAYNCWLDPRPKAERAGEKP